jgi:hypothetical protein
MGALIAIKLLPETLRRTGYATIVAGTGSYVAIGSSFDNPIRIFHLQNLTNETLLFSWDGIDDHLAIPTNGFILLDLAANKTIEQGSFFQVGQQIYVRYDSVNFAAPTSGGVYLTVFYGTTL